MPRSVQPERVLREVERLPAAADPDAFFGALVATLAQQGFEFAGACWHLTDPATGLFVWTGHRGELPGDFASALENEFLEEDVGKYAELAGRRRRAASLVSETGGEPRRSARFRRQLAPDGFADELRFAFADSFGRWGSLGLFSERVFAAGEQEAAVGLVPVVARALREGVALTTAAPAEGAPGVLLLDADDRVVSRDARAAELLDGAAATGALPGAVHVLAARARACGGPVQGRTRGGGGEWIGLDASPLDDGDPTAGGGKGSIAVVLRPAPAHSLLELRLRAAGLTEREREIARALLRGEDTATIAAGLHLSPWTVQDHLKAIFDKTGVRSRRAFVARWALQAAAVE
ncbi:MAG: helix-turn-helix transcriptional regulator [Syntrophothermus sp.]